MDLKAEHVDGLLEEVATLDFGYGLDDFLGDFFPAILLFTVNIFVDHFVGVFHDSSDVWVLLLEFHILAMREFTLLPILVSEYEFIRHFCLIFL